MTESQYQAKLIRKIERMFPGCLVLKNNPAHIQGIPDLLILYLGTWGALEVKLDGAPHQPNQAHYVDRMKEMSFASFISPFTEKDVLNDLQHALTSDRPSRIS
jgi:hypothetical protein